MNCARQFTDPDESGNRAENEDWTIEDTNFAIKLLPLLHCSKETRSHKDKTQFNNLISTIKFQGQLLYTKKPWRCQIHSDSMFIPDSVPDFRV